MADVSRLLLKASKLHKKGQLTDAEKLYNKVLSSAPGYIPAFNPFGILLAQKGRYAEALQYFEKAINATPSDTSPHENVARMWLTMGEMEKARAAYKSVLRINPASYAALYGLGYILQLEKQYRQAMAMFAKALAISAGDPLLLLNLGMCYQQLGQVNDAFAQYRKALDLNPRSVDANAALGHLYLQEQNYPKAGEFFQCAVDLGVKRADIEFGLAQCLQHAGNEDQAGKHYFAAVELDPESQNAYIQLDQFLLSSGGEEKQAFLKELGSDYIYVDWHESRHDLCRLAELSNFPDAKANQALQSFMDDYDPGVLHDRSWWQQHLDSFGGVNNTHDKRLRSLHSAVYCWSLPDKESLSAIADFVSGTRLYSYGAGSGVWERLLQQHFDVNVVASDITLRHRFLPMEIVDYAKADVAPTDSIFFAWVIRGDRNMLQILDKMQSGQRLVLIGEPPDSEGVPRICGTPEMWRVLATEFTLTQTIALVSYSLFHDTLSLFIKN